MNVILPVLGIILYQLSYFAAYFTQTWGLFGAVGAFLPPVMVLFSIIMMLPAIGKILKNKAAERFAVRILWLESWAIPVLPLFAEVIKAGANLRDDPDLLAKAVWMGAFTLMSFMIFYTSFEKAWRKEWARPKTMTNLNSSDKTTGDPVASGIVQKLKDGETLTFHTRKGYWGLLLESLPYFIAFSTSFIYLYLKGVFGLMELSLIGLWLLNIIIMFIYRKMSYQKELILDHEGIKVYYNAQSFRAMSWKEVERIHVIVTKSSSFENLFLPQPNGIVCIRLLSSTDKLLIVSNSIELIPSFIYVFGLICKLNPQLININRKEEKVLKLWEM